MGMRRSGMRWGGSVGIRRLLVYTQIIPRIRRDSSGILGGGNVGMWTHCAESGSFPNTLR